MAYIFTVRIYQSNTNAYFTPIETSVHDAGYWSNTDGQYTLNMGFDTSGAIRLHSGSENVVVFIGNHNKKVWCDLDTDIEGNTAAKLNAQYYDGKVMERERGRHMKSVTAVNYKMRRFCVDLEGEGNQFVANIIIQ
ncbi:hypothetical protein EYR40_008495 [Pleurotus pulmonarius]|nr:hypothetical protein EYR36_009313 [Pleurotus pulmonarius]KAF4593705.1 hypothetical protein EYR40_008495 [Pleurotus pulmonarius]